MYMYILFRVHPFSWRLNVCEKGSVHLQCLTFTRIPKAILFISLGGISGVTGSITMDRQRPHPVNNRVVWALSSQPQWHYYGSNNALGQKQVKCLKRYRILFRNNLCLYLFQLPLLMKLIFGKLMEGNGQEAFCASACKEWLYRRCAGLSCLIQKPSRVQSQKVWGKYKYTGARSRQCSS